MKFANWIMSLAVGLAALTLLMSVGCRCVDRPVILREGVYAPRFIRPAVRYERPLRP